MATKTRFLPLFMLLPLFGFSGCAPRTNYALEQAETELALARRDPVVAMHAPEVLSEAETTLRQAEIEWREDRDGEEARSYAYIVQRQVQMAREQTRGEIALEMAGTTAEELAARADAHARLADKSMSEAAETRLLVEELRRDIAALQTSESLRGFEIAMREDVLFETGRAELKPGAYRKLEPLAEFLRNHPHRSIIIEGHTDGVGDASYNRRLSQDRVDAVRDYLVGEGVSASRVVSRGMGEEFPVASNDTAEGRLQNRRVEIIISE